jgi:hypothetical protein
MDDTDITTFNVGKNMSKTGWQCDSTLFWFTQIHSECGNCHGKAGNVLVQLLLYF